MAIVKPFRGLRPQPEYALQVAAPPYDVIDSDEARKMAEGKPLSFLHVNKPEIDLDPGVDLYDKRVYEQGAKSLAAFIDKKVFIQDEHPCFYLYRQVMGKHQQVGLVAVVSVDEYRENKIKKHELTRVDKEDDRLNHIMKLGAQTGPVFLTYKSKQKINTLFKKLTSNTPAYDFPTADGIQHSFWKIADAATIQKIEKGFAAIEALYVADGHHRSAAAMRACDQHRETNKNHKGDEPYNFFLAVLFPHNQMQILAYNRVVNDLNGLSETKFLEKLAANFLVRSYSRSQGYIPVVKHDFGMYLNGWWYRLSAIPGFWDNYDPVKRLDVSILYDNILKPVLDIGDPRTDKRMDFVGGIRGIEELEKRVDQQELAVAFSLFPTSIDDLLSIADAQAIMPPKSTWFEPKLRSGLVVHLLD